MGESGKHEMDAKTGTRLGAASQSLRDDQLGAALKLLDVLSQSAEEPK